MARSGVVRIRGTWLGAVALASAALLTSCGGTQDDAAGSVAQQLLSDAAQQRGDKACSLLAPAAREELADSSGRPCAEAILEEGLGASASPVDVRVYDPMAHVRFATDTVFLSRFDGERLVVAAACVPRAGGPYDCDIQVS